MGKVIKHTIKAMSQLPKSKLVVIFTLLVTVFMWCKPAEVSAAVGRVGTGGTGGGTATSYNITIPATTAGNTLIAVVGAINNANIVNSITGGGTWVRAASSISASTEVTEIWYCPNVTAGVTTVTVNTSSSVGTSIAVQEYSGVLAASPLDKTATASGSASAQSTGTTATTAAANELWIAGFSTGVTGTYSGQSAGWTITKSTANGAVQTALVDNLSNTASAAACSITGPNGPYAGAVATFVPTGTPWVSYIASSTAGAASGNLTIAAPTGLAAGDVMIISIVDRGTTGTAPSMSSTGWTTLQSLAINPASTYRYGFSAYKVATAADVGATYTVTNGAAANISADIYAFRGVNTTSPIDVQNGQANTTASTTVTAPTITTTAANDKIVFLGQVAETTATTFSGWATANIAAANWTSIDSAGSANGSTGAAYATLTTAGATGAGTVTITSYRNGGVLIALKPISIVNPTITTPLSPNNMTQGTGPTTVTINGTGFQSGATVTFSGAGITTGAVTFVSATQLTVPVTVAANATAAAGNVTVTNPDTGTATAAGAFTVNAAPAPTVASTSPNNMVQGTGPTIVTITGTNFLSGSTVAFSGTGITLGAVTYVNSTTLTVPVTVAAGATLGASNVTVTLPGGQTGTGTGVFTVNSPCAAQPPTALAAGAATTTSIPLTWTTSISGSDYYRVYRSGVQVSTDGAVTTGAFTDAGPLNSSTTYSYYVTGHNIAANCDSAPTATINKSTLAVTPSAPSVSNVGNGTSAYVTIGSDANSTEATYAIRINGGAFVNQFVLAGGTVGASAVWQTKAAWGTVTVTGLTSGTAYNFDVEARNGNGELIVTAFSLQTSVTPHVALSSTIANCGGCHFYTAVAGKLPADGTARNTPAGLFQGNHATHAGDTSIAGQYGFACTKCHNDNTAKGNAHQNGFINLSGSSLSGSAYAAGAYAATHKKPVSNTPTFYNCNGIYCHSQGTGGTLQAGDTRPVNPVASPTWGSPFGSLACNGCHGAPPSYANGVPKMNSHTSARGHKTVTCDVCHSSVTYSGGVYTPNAALHNNGVYDILAAKGYTYAVTGGTCATPGNGCHGPTPGTWGGILGCVDCHNKIITRTKGRPGATLANVVGEFGLAYGHKKSGRGAVTNADCCVCHLEGNSVTYRPTAYHQDGNIDLRDPVGAGATPITNMAGAAWTFQRFSTSYAAGSRTTTGNTANTIDNIITQKFCLGCHRSTGATNPTARSGASATQYMPWNGVNLGANYTVANGASVLGGLVNVFSQFSTGNSSYHPVRGPLNKDFPTPARMNAPYNNFSRTGTTGSKTLGVVINCFDCHNNNTGTLLTTRTISAHGTNNTAQVRGLFYGSSMTLCTTCHFGYTVDTNHNGAGSAAGTMSGNGGEGMASYCTNCHAGGVGQNATAAPARPIPGANYHGFNKLLNGNNWPDAGYGRPYAFFRNDTNLTDHRPYTASDITVGSPTCNGSGKSCANGSAQSYSPGGSY